MRFVRHRQAVLKRLAFSLHHFSLPLSMKSSTFQPQSGFRRCISGRNTWKQAASYLMDQALRQPGGRRQRSWRKYSMAVSRPISRSSNR